MCCLLLLTFCSQFLFSRQSIWLPFVRDELAADEHSILIGHSSGAVACARYAEKYKVKGICVCAGYDDDLGDATERASGYFDTPWDYRKIQENTQFRVCFAGARDHLVPIDVQRRFAKNLDAKCVEFPEGGHFFTPTFEELMREIEKALDETEDET
jgi:predicted alpha/beta hydrolase family esterase